LREALVFRRPVFRNPWDSVGDMFATYFAVSVIVPLTLFCGGKLMGLIFDFSSHWHRGIFMAAALVGTAGFITIVGRERTRLSVDVLAIAAWLVLGLVIAPILGLAPSTGVSIACYAVMLLGIFVYVLRFGQWETGFIRTLSWPVIWSALGVVLAYSAYRCIFFP
jgi:hypothetical protein